MKKGQFTGLAAVVFSTWMGISIAGCMSEDTGKDFTSPKSNYAKMQESGSRKQHELPPATMSDGEYSLINQRVAEYVIPSGRLGDLVFMGETCWEIKDLVRSKHYDRAQEIYSKADERTEKLCGVELLLGYIKGGYEEFKGGNTKKSKQLYEAAKSLAPLINKILHPSDAPKNYYAISLLLPVLNEPFERSVWQLTKNYQEVIQQGSIYGTLFDSAKVNEQKGIPH